MFDSQDKLSMLVFINPHPHHEQLAVRCICGDVWRVSPMLHLALHPTRSWRTDFFDSIYLAHMYVHASLGQLLLHY